VQDPPTGSIFKLGRLRDRTVIRER
jgi:hypothetical protein